MDNFFFLIPLLYPDFSIDDMIIYFNKYLPIVFQRLKEVFDEKNNIGKHNILIINKIRTILTLVKTLKL